MESSGKNRTPDKLPLAERKPLDEVCDRHLATVIDLLDCEWLIGVGAYAEQCLRRVADSTQKIGKILHPSPASPAANRGWATIVTGQLVELGVWRD
jgi:single-strand selective monofunctional uracil DNA glycosylase